MPKNTSTDWDKAGFPQTHFSEGNTNSYFGTVVRFGLQFIHGCQSLKKAALQEAHWCLPVKTSLWIGQHQSKGNGETCHVHWEGPTGAPASVEANHLQENSAGRENHLNEPLP